jgi:hypothetical protein
MTAELPALPADTFSVRLTRCAGPWYAAEVTENVLHRGLSVRLELGAHSATMGASSIYEAHGIADRFCRAAGAWQRLNTQ